MKHHLSHGQVSGYSKGTNSLLYAVIFIWLFSSCSVSRQLGMQAKKTLLEDSAVKSGHIGISLFEPATGKYLYDYNATRYFVPASNVKLFTLYAAMKYLGDSLVGVRYTENNIVYHDTTPITDLVKIFPTGDPTFLNPEFPAQPVFDFLKKLRYLELCEFNEVKPYGSGWAWDDYLEGFMRPRTPFPVYKNVFTITYVKKDSVTIQPGYFRKRLFLPATFDSGFSVHKAFLNNIVGLTDGIEKVKKIPIDDANLAEVLQDTLKFPAVSNSSWRLEKEDLERKYKIIHSQPTDSLLQPMMHNSDNFYAEQALLMVSNEQLGYMNDEAIIDSLLKSDLKDIPQQPRWVDGSGLSRYNLFTPQSFVYILNKMKDEFGMQRLKGILPTGGEGTLKNYYLTDRTFIYAKTGSLSNQVALSGFLTTGKNKQLVFSILVNNATGSSTEVRRAIEKFLKAVRKKF